MAKGVVSQEKGSSSTGLILSAAVLAILAIHLARGVLTEAFSADGILYDSDVYMWMVRVEALAEGRGWFDHLESRINPPEGHVQHWTRPLDFLLLLGAKLLSPFLGFKDGLGLWTALLSPILHLVALVGVYKTCLHFMSSRGAAMAASVFGLQYITILTFFWGRGDHHSLLTLGQVFFFLALVRGLTPGLASRKWACLAGVIGALSIWVNAEALAYVLLGLVLVGLQWLFGVARQSGLASWLGGGLFLGTLGAVAIERGPEFFVEFPIDTIGLPYLTLFGLTALFFVVIERLGKQKIATSFLGRFSLATVFAVMVLGALYFLHPQFYSGPFEGVEDLYGELRLANLSEQQPALTFDQGGHHFWGYLLIWYGLLLPALLGLVLGWRQWGQEQRWLVALFIGSALLFGLLGLFQVRWLAYLPAGAVLGVGVMANELFKWMETKRWYREEAFRPLVISFFFFGPTVLGLGIAAAGVGDELQGGALVFVEEGEDPIYFDTECDLRGAAQVLRGFETPQLILLEPDRGAEVLFRTDHKVLTIANHRVQPGFNFFVDIMSEQDEVRALGELQSRGVDLVMVCVGSVWRPLRGTAEQPSMMERWARGEEIPGLEVLGRPDLLRGWWIYAVRPEEHEHQGSQ